MMKRLFHTLFPASSKKAPIISTWLGKPKQKVGVAIEATHVNRRLKRIATINCIDFRTVAQSLTQSSQKLHQLQPRLTFIQNRYRRQPLRHHLIIGGVWSTMQRKTKC